MKQWARIGLMTAVMIIGLGWLGCADDLYGECSIDPEPDDPLNACLMEEEGAQQSCVVEGQFECETGACGRYRGSEPFCTQSCTNNDDCGSGFCREFVFQSGTSHCVPADEIDG